MVSTLQQAINHIVIGMLALLLIGGSLLLLVLRIEVPQYWQNFDGMVIVAAFANGAFFVQARTSLPVANALAQAQDQYHSLAMSMSTSGTNPSTPASTISGTGSKS